MISRLGGESFPSRVGASGLCFFLCLLLPAFGLGSPGEALGFRRITVREGLSQTSVLCLTEGDQGYIWMGTFDGLNRFDGRNFKVFRNDPEDPFSISDNTVNAMVADQDGNLWVGTNHGLNRLNRSTGGFSRFYVNPDGAKGPQHNQVRSLFQEDDGQLWVGTGRGVCRFSGGRFNLLPFADLGDQDVPILTMLKDRSGTLWVGTWGRGLYQLDGDDVLRPFRNDDDLPLQKIISIVQDRHGDLWFASMDQGLIRYDPRTQKATHYRHDPGDPGSLANDTVRVVREDPAGTLWVGTYGGGLDRFDPLQRRFIHYQHAAGRASSLSSNSVISLLVDRTGALWVGTFLGGANRADEHNINFTVMEPALTGGEKQFWSIMQDQRRQLWLGGEKGVYRQDLENGAMRKMSRSPENPNGMVETTIWDMDEAADGAIWFGTGEGLVRYQQDQDRFVHFRHDPQDDQSLSSDSTLSVLVDGRNRVWASTINTGLNCLDPTTGKAIRFFHERDNPESLGDNMPREIIEDKAGVIWIGTFTGGLNRYRDNGTFRQYLHHEDDPHSLSHNTVINLIQDRREQNVLWLATADGLNRFHKNEGRFEAWGIHDGLPNNYIYAMGQDVRGLLWFSCNKGLAVFDPERASFRGFDIRDGLPVNEFNGGAFGQDDEGRMYFGSIEGLVSFRPREFRPNRNRLPLVFKEFYLDNKPVRPRPLNPTSPLTATLDQVRRIELDHQQRMVGISFTGLEFSAPWHCRYLYRMEGFDGDWLSADGTDLRATYTNLPPGTYTFRVKGGNPDGYWNEQTLEVDLEVHAAPWLTVRAKALYVLIILALVGFYLRSQWRRLQRQQRIAHQERLLKEQAQLMAEQERATATRLEQQVKERTSALITSEKMASLGMLASGVAHELNNPNNFVFGGAQSLDACLVDLRALVEKRWGRNPRDEELTALWELLEDMAEQLSLVQKGAARIRTVTSHMEQFVRRGEDFTRTNIVKGLASTITLVRSRFPEVVFDIVGADELFCQVRAGELNQVFLNLVLNACEAIERRRALDPEAPARLTVEAVVVGWMAVLRFEDSGIGFPKEAGEHLFEAFFTTKINSEAAGLGLYTSWQIVNDHKGKLQAVSEPGLGSTFTLTLPLMREKPM